MTKTFISALAMCLLFSGCMTYQSQQQAARTRQTEDHLIQQEKMQRMAGRLETLEMEIGRISREVDGLRQSLDARFSAAERKANEDKQQMISQLSSQMASLINQSVPSPAASSPSGGGGRAYMTEHIVEAGHTLSAIAKAYGVTTKAIIEANNLKNPNRLSIGQKLLIPE